MNIISRYFFWRYTRTFIWINVLLCLIMSINRLIYYMHLVALGQLSLWVVGEIMFYQSLEYMVMILPVSLFVSSFLVLSMAHMSSESVVLYTAGFSRHRFFGILVAVTLLVFVIQLYLLFWVEPRVKNQRKVLSNASSTSMLLSTIRPQQFLQLPGQPWTIYADSVSAQHDHFKGVWMAKRTRGHLGHINWEVVMAPTADLIYRGPQLQPFIVLHKGSDTMGQLGGKQYTRKTFSDMGLSLWQPNLQVVLSSDSLKDLPALWGDMKNNRSALVEFLWRLSFAFAILLLAPLAFFMAWFRPRQEAFHNLLPGFLCFVVYCSVLMTIHKWVEANKLAMPFLFVPHIVMILVLIAIWRYKRRLI